MGQNTIFQKNHFFTKKLIAQKLVRVNQWPLYQNQAMILGYIRIKQFRVVRRDRGEISKAVGRNTIFQKNHFFTKKLIAQKLVRVNQWPLYQNQAMILGYIRHQTVLSSSSRHRRNKQSSGTSHEFSKRNQFFTKKLIT